MENKKETLKENVKQDKTVPYNLIQEQTKHLPTIKEITDILGIRTYDTTVGDIKVHNLEEDAWLPISFDFILPEGTIVTKDTDIIWISNFDTLFQKENKHKIFIRMSVFDNKVINLSASIQINGLNPRDKSPSYVCTGVGNATYDEMDFFEALNDYFNNTCDARHDAYWFIGTDHSEMKSIIEQLKAFKTTSLPAISDYQSNNTEGWSLFAKYFQIKLISTLQKIKSDTVQDREKAVHVLQTTQTKENIINNYIKFTNLEKEIK